MSFRRRREASLVKLERVTFWVSSYYYDKIAEAAHENKIPVARQLQTLIDNAVTILGDDAYKLDTELIGTYEEFEFAEEAGRILNYMKFLKNPQGLDSLMLTRHDIGVPDKDRFLGGFMELLSSKLIKECKPEWKENAVKYEGYKVYKPTEDMHGTKVFDKAAEIKALKEKIKKLEKGV